MANLTPRDTFFQDLFDFPRDFDQIFNRFLSWPSGPEQRTLAAGFAPAVEALIDKDGKNFRAQVSLPGVDPKDVKIHVQGNLLSISGERRETRETKEADYLHREISYGSFERTLSLPEGVDTEKLTAEYRNGVLEITAPMAAAALPRKIEIKTTPSARQMTA